MGEVVRWVGIAEGDYAWGFGKNFVRERRVGWKYPKTHGQPRKEDS